MAQVGPAGGADGFPSAAVAVPAGRDSLARKQSSPAAPPVPRVGSDLAPLPISQGTFRSVPRREVQATPNPKTGTPEFQIVVVNGIVMHVPPDGWLA